MAATETTKQGVVGAISQKEPLCRPPQSHTPAAHVPSFWQRTPLHRSGGAPQLVPVYLRRSDAVMIVVRFINAIENPDGDGAQMT